MSDVFVNQHDDVFVYDVFFYDAPPRSRACSPVESIVCTSSRSVSADVWWRYLSELASNAIASADVLPDKYQRRRAPVQVPAPMCSLKCTSDFAKKGISGLERIRRALRQVESEGVSDLERIRRAQRLVDSEGVHSMKGKSGGGVARGSLSPRARPIAGEGRAQVARGSLAGGGRRAPPPPPPLSIPPPLQVCPSVGGGRRAHCKPPPPLPPLSLVQPTAGEAQAQVQYYSISPRSLPTVGAGHAHDLLQDPWRRDSPQLRQFQMMIYRDPANPRPLGLKLSTEDGIYRLLDVAPTGLVADTQWLYRMLQDDRLIAVDELEANEMNKVKVMSRLRSVGTLKLTWQRFV